MKVEEGLDRLVQRHPLLHSHLVTAPLAVLWSPCAAAIQLQTCYAAGGSLGGSKARSSGNHRRSMMVTEYGQTSYSVPTPDGLPNTTMQPPIGARRFRLIEGEARAACG